MLGIVDAHCELQPFRWLPGSHPVTVVTEYLATEARLHLHGGLSQGREGMVKRPRARHNDQAHPPSHCPMHSATVITTRRGKTQTWPANVGSGIGQLIKGTRFHVPSDSRTSWDCPAVLPSVELFLVGHRGQHPSNVSRRSCSSLHSGVYDAVREPSMESSTIHRMLSFALDPRQDVPKVQEHVNRLVDCLMETVHHEGLAGFTEASGRYAKQWARAP